MQAKWSGHSLLLIHSGLQFGGELINPARHEHDGLSLITLHSEFGPQGDGWHGLIGIRSSTEKKNVNILVKIFLKILLMGVHLKNGSPVCFDGQLHIGLWLTTWHIAPIPHVPGQGLIHFWLTHAWVSEHSALDTHSGLHVGGLPINPCIQEQTAWLFTTRHWLLGPQGDNWQGLVRTGSAKTFAFWVYADFCCSI